MQIKATNTHSKFNPVQVVITIETPGEFKALYQVGNYNSFVADMVSDYADVSEEDIKKLLKELWQQLDAIHPNGKVK